MVLHGGSSAHPQDLAQAIAKGVAKVNVATSAFLHFTLEVRSRVQEEVDPRKYLAPGREALARWLASFYLSLP
ncbi:class II fructose-bisphosphate aldolase [Thermus sp.]|uniref:class II fructose-bisphosphate aldolase n=1 Tax=Thermus sp. TaxID=275 RepID=UPI0039A71A55